MLHEYPRVQVIPPFNGDTLENLTIFDRKGTPFKLRGETALREYKDYYRGKNRVLYHGTFRSPRETGQTLEPHQSYSRHKTVERSENGRMAVCASDSHKFPIVRSLFHRRSPVFEDFPEDEYLLGNFIDVSGREITIITKKGLETVRKANPKGYVHVLHQDQPDGSRAEYFEDPDGNGDEYRYYQPVTPEFVMPVTVDDLPWGTAVVEDTNLAMTIRAKRRNINLEYFANGKNIVDIYGNPFFENINSALV